MDRTTNLRPSFVRQSPLEVLLSRIPDAQQDVADFKPPMLDDLFYSSSCPKLLRGCYVCSLCLPSIWSFWFPLRFLQTDRQTYPNVADSNLCGCDICCQTIPLLESYVVYRNSIPGAVYRAFFCSSWNGEPRVKTHLNAIRGIGDDRIHEWMVFLIGI